MIGEEHDLQKISLKGCAPIFWIWLVLFVLICGGYNIGIEQGWWKSSDPPTEAPKERR